MFQENPPAIIHHSHQIFNNTDNDFWLQGMQGSEMDVNSSGLCPITTLLTAFNFQVLLQQ